MLRAVAVALFAVCASIFMVPVFAQADAQLISFWNDRNAGSKINIDHSQWQDHCARDNPVASACPWRRGAPLPGEINPCGIEPG